MIGAIAGDIIGSVHEWAKTKHTDFKLFQSNCTFTDDTVLTLAVADAILKGKPYAPSIKTFGNRHFARGYGGMFRKWLVTEGMEPYNSYGNGSGMRVSAVGFAFDRMEDVLREAERSAEVTHNHPEGIKGAQAIAASILLARQHKDKDRIKEFVSQQFGYDLNRTIATIRQTYKFDVTCQGSVPEAILAFLESHDVESAIRLGISLGGDADTIACMAGGIAQAYYGAIPKVMQDKVRELLTPDLLEVLEAFEGKYQVQYQLI